jgi:hypothetical protein
MIGRFHRPGALSVVAVLVVLVFVAVFLLSMLGGSSSGTFSSVHRAEFTPAVIASLPLGSSRRDVERKFGQGQDALGRHGFGFGDTGVAVEPMDASCIYYGEAAAGNRHALAQLCFQHDKLSSKREFPAVRGALFG